jgi:hypothetical protein
VARGREADHSPGNSWQGRPNASSRPRPWLSLRRLNGFGLTLRRDLMSFDCRRDAAHLFLWSRSLACRLRFLNLKVFLRLGLGRGTFLVGGNFTVNDGQLDFKT